MAREDWQDLDDEGRRARLNDNAGEAGSPDAYGDEAPRTAEPPRSFLERAGDFFSPRSAATRQPRAQRGPSDRVLSAVIMERLDRVRGLDLRDVRLVVEEAEVTLDGTVRHKADKRRIEDVADVRGIRHVQNNLRVRDNGRWTFF